MLTPGASTEQLMTEFLQARTETARANLRRANYDRLQRAAMRRMFSNMGGRRARELAAMLISDPPRWLEGMPVGEFLSRIPHITPHRAGRVCERRGIDPVLRTVGGERGLSAREAVQLAASLRAPGGLQ